MRIRRTCVCIMLLCSAQQISSFFTSTHPPFVSPSRRKKSLGMFSFEDKGTGEHSFNLLDSSGWYSEHRPRRLPDVATQASKAGPTKTPDFQEEWGLERDHQVDFPATMSDVVDQAFTAIAGTLYQTQSLDPNIASNAMSRSIFTQRPVRKALDMGRIGLEIDGVEHLFPYPHRVSSVAATRRLALLLSAKLSSKESWKSFEKSEGGAIETLDKRPIVVCFNTIKQALVASSELHRLKHRYFLEHKGDSETSPFDNIKIQCIHDEIPKELHLDPSQRRRSNGLLTGFVNPTKGLILVVQPTDYNEEFKPPGPAVDAVGNFQKLAARATIEEAPLIALSPRFLSSDNIYGGWDQSGYQKSATYGGIEPPRGPTPWIMRDFTPPAFCWIGNALTVSGVGTRCSGGICEQCFLSRVVLTQSVMDPGHSWNIFVAKECTHGNEKSPIEYIFLARTRSAAGRPTRAVLQKLVEDC